MWLKPFLVALLSQLFITNICFAQSIITEDGVSFPKVIKNSSGSDLFLNGIGYRKVTLFKIKVYAAGLYLHIPSENAHEILAMNTEKRLRIHFLRDVSKDDVQEAFTDNFMDNNPESHFLSKINELSSMLPAVSENDELEIIFGETGISVNLNNQLLTHDNDKTFGTGVLRIWLGTEPPNRSLQKDILSRESLAQDE
jgi:hypothetical protein